MKGKHSFYHILSQLLDLGKMQPGSAHCLWSAAFSFDKQMSKYFRLSLLTDRLYLTILYYWIFLSSPPRPRHCTQHGSEHLCILFWMISSDLPRSEITGSESMDLSFKILKSFCQVIFKRIVLLYPDVRIDTWIFCMCTGVYKEARF